MLRGGGDGEVYRIDGGGVRDGGGEMEEDGALFFGLKGRCELGKVFCLRRLDWEREGRREGAQGLRREGDRRFR